MHKMEWGGLWQGGCWQGGRRQVMQRCLLCSEQGSFQTEKESISGDAAFPADGHVLVRCYRICSGIACCMRQGRLSDEDLTFAAGLGTALHLVGLQAATKQIDDCYKGGPRLRKLQLITGPAVQHHPTPCTYTAGRAASSQQLWQCRQHPATAVHPESIGQTRCTAFPRSWCSITAVDAIPPGQTASQEPLQPTFCCIALSVAACSCTHPLSSLGPSGACLLS